MCCSISFLNATRSLPGPVATMGGQGQSSVMEVMLTCSTGLARKTLIEL
jgi:hypothetical protein